MKLIILYKNTDKIAPKAGGESSSSTFSINTSHKYISFSEISLATRANQI
jgi:hypothetical protein